MIFSPAWIFPSPLTSPLGTVAEMLESSVSNARKSVPSDFDPKGALLELTVTPSCTSASNKRPRGVRAAVALNLEAKAVSGEDGEEFYSGDVRAVGFFVCDPTMDAKDIEKEANERGSYFEAAFSVVHAIASRELERQIELTGIPAPLIPMSRGHGEVAAAKNKL